MAERDDTEWQSGSYLLVRTPLDAALRLVGAHSAAGRSCGVLYTLHHRHPGTARAKGVAMKFADARV